MDIPQFAVIKSNIASGQEPFAEGVIWLKTQRLSRVLHPRAPGEDDKTARLRSRRTACAIRSLEVMPQTLSKEIVEQFNRLGKTPTISRFSSMTRRVHWWAVYGTYTSDWWTS